jgi:hypothetical protein
MNKKNVVIINLTGIAVFLLTVFSLGFNSCIKEEKAAIPYTLPYYISVDGSKFVAQYVPTSQEDTSDIPEIDTLTSNSNFLDIQYKMVDTLLVTDTTIINTFIIPVPDTIYLKVYSTSENLTKAYVYIYSIGGEYYLLDIQNYKTGEGEYTIPLNISKQANPKFIVEVKLENSNGYTSSAYPMAFSIYDIMIGKFNVTCAWDKKNDLDLSLIDPMGAILDVNSETSESYPSLRRSTTNGYLRVSNEGCVSDSSKEVITYDNFSIIYLGEYIVKVDMFSHCNIDSITNYTVTLTVNGDTIQGVSTSNPYFGSFLPDLLYREPLEVMRFNIDESMINKSGASVERLILTGDKKPPLRIVTKQKSY